MVVNLPTKESKKKKPYVISILNQKGGVGKTTIATNLSRGLIISGFNTLLIDGDPQGSARDWHEANGAQLVPCVGLDRDTLPVDLGCISMGFDVIVIDGAPQIQKLSLAALRVSDLVLIPVQPSPYDVWATQELVDLIQNHQQVNLGRPEATFVISRCIKNTNIGKDVTQALTDFGFPVMESRTSQHVMYPQTAAMGLSVFPSRFPFTGAAARNPATIEFLGLVNEIINKYINK